MTNYTKIFEDTTLYPVFKYVPQKGNLVYEYNPFRNYRLNSTKYYYNSKYYSEEDLFSENIISEIFYLDKNLFSIDENIVSCYRLKINDDNYLKYTFPLNFLDYTYDLQNYTTTSGKFLILFDNITKNYFLYDISKEKYLNQRFEISDEKVLFTLELCTDITLINELYNLTFDNKEYIKTIISFNSNSTCFYKINYDLQLFEKLDNNILIYEKGSLVDFSTDELQFDINHPVDIIPQYSYDGSVNLFLNDGSSSPKIINSRFSVTGKNTYQVVDRKGNNDTNIYNEGATFLSDISLYKQYNTISKVELLSIFSGGNLACGNYYFYFTYCDSDGNESDFFAESGLISIFIGTTIYAKRQGFRDETSNKGIRFKLVNLDPQYNYLKVYYSRTTGDINLNSTKNYYSLTDKIFITNSSNFYFSITGYEDTNQITESDINPIYSYVENAKTLCFNSNMLFLGNIQKCIPNYTELTDLSLHFLPYLDTNTKYTLDNSYRYSEYTNSYSNEKFIYNYTGYWPNEIYRFGIVYILNDGSLSPVFNIRGKNNIFEYSDNNTLYTNKSIYNDDGTRNYIEIDENTNLLVSGYWSQLENAKGVCIFNSKLNSLSSSALVYGINIKADSEDLITELKKYCKGFFFVRLRRIPTTLCQGVVIPTDEIGHHPAILSSTNCYLESFLSLIESTHPKKYLTEETSPRLISVINPIYNAMLCPDYDVNYIYLNSILNGLDVTVIKSDFLPKSIQMNTSQNVCCFNSYTGNMNRKTSSDIKILGVEDSTPLVCCGDNRFSGVAGIALLGYKFDYVNDETKETDNCSIVRGLWGPFLGLNTSLEKNTIYDIKIPGYSTYNISDYFLIRISDKTSYYAISDRIDINNIDDTINIGTFYRGDCYICKFTHRLHRNFNDDSAPYNDKIANPKTWYSPVSNGFGEDDDDDYDETDYAEHILKDYKYFCEDDVIRVLSFEHINLGDINAVPLGFWYTFYVRSSINLNIRAIDESDVDLVAKTGHAKGFYPYFPMSKSGNYKHAEALCYNKGYETSVSERYNYEVPDVPVIKNSFTGRIMYSNPQINDAFINGCRKFISTHYQDYPLTYGSITKLIPFEKSIIVVFEHGITLLSVNERNLIPNLGNVYLESGKVIPDKDATKIISEIYGSLWKDSIIKTPFGLYGVDTIAKKIWFTDGNTIRCISDFKVQKFLNDNISLTELELEPILGIRNVKTHYNAFKRDVMFTFYDNLEGIQEKAWNLCWNEDLGVFTTFYSWIPSFSENIYNLYFSFDRLTSKWIAKLGQSSKNSSYKGNVYLNTPEIENNAKINDKITRIYINEDSLGIINSKITNCKILRDNLYNYKNFDVEIEGNSANIILKTDITNLFAELYECSGSYNYNGEIYLYCINDSILNSLENSESSLLYYNNWKEAIFLGKEINYLYDSSGLKIPLTSKINSNKIVLSLNLQVTYTSDNNETVNIIELTVYLVPKYNLLFLTTDFWKHGLSGIIDIKDKIKPTYWYGKQHPFEFEFIVNKTPSAHKIFDNLIILSNNAEPESFHYEIVGDTYDFIDDKKNMYFRLEATEAYYQHWGADIEYDGNFTEIVPEHKYLYEINKYDIDDEFGNTVRNGETIKYVKGEDSNNYIKSSLCPLFYTRTNSYNEIEDYYLLKTSPNHNYDGRSGTEIVRNELFNSYHLWEHVKAIDSKSPGGRLRSNMEYKENFWRILIPPINILLKNEKDWINNVPPIVISNSPVPELEFDDNDKEFPDILSNLNYNDTCIDTTEWNSLKLIKLKDKYIKIKIRYSGKKLAVIQAVLTLFRISYA